MANELIKIPLEKWPELRDMYTSRKERASCYNLLQTLINWKDRKPELDICIYSLNGSWEINGTFVVKFLRQVYFNTCESTLESLLKALNCLNSPEHCVFSGYQGILEPAVKQHFVDCGLGKSMYKPTNCVWYHIARDKAKLFTVNHPYNVQLRPLKEHNAEQINNVWPHRSPGSIEFVKLLIRENDSIGIFEDNNLIAWCLLLPLGALGLLQVMDTHKRKGFGSLAVRYLSKLLSEKNIEVTAPVVAENVASRSMFEQLGFKNIDTVFWTDKPAKE